MNFLPYLHQRMERGLEDVLRLCQDLTDETMVLQPIPGTRLNHPAWTLSHLANYGDVIGGLARGDAEVPDPKDRPFGHGSVPEPGIAVYGSAAAVIARYRASVAAAMAGLAAGRPDLLDAPIPIIRWRERFPTRGIALLHLVISHESWHHGQISAWRKAAGAALPPLR